MKKREKYEEFLKGIELLEGMDTYERSKIADALKVIMCKNGETGLDRYSFKRLLGPIESILQRNSQKYEM